MAKAQRKTTMAVALEGAGIVKGKPENRGLSLVQAQAAQGGAPKARMVDNPIFVLDGAAGEVDATAFAVVKPSDILSAGTTLKALAMNLLAGSIDPALLDAKAPCWKDRAIKDAKTAFFRLVQHPAAKLREVWAKDQAARKAKANGRLTQVSLSALAKLFKPERVGNTVPPMTRLKQTVAEYCEGATAALRAKKPDVKKALAFLQKIEEATATDE